MTASPRSSRRRFLKIATAAGISAALVPSLGALARGATPVPAKSTPATKPNATPAPAAGAAPPDASLEFKDDAQAQLAIVRRRYGKHLDEKQLEAIGTELNDRMQGGKAMRAAKLGNGEEPDATFHA